MNSIVILRLRLILALCFLGSLTTSYAQQLIPVFEGKTLAQGSRELIQYGNIQDEVKSFIEAHADRLNSSFRAYDLFDFSADHLYQYVNTPSDSIIFFLKLGDIYGMRVVLFPDELRGDNISERIISLSGEEKVQEHETITYRGYIDEERGGDVRLTINGHFLQGYITLDGKKVFIENVDHLLGEAPATQFITYSEDEVIAEGPLACEIVSETDDHTKQFSEQGVAEACEGVFEVEIAIAATYSLYQSFNNDQNAVRNHILSTINSSQGDYDRFKVKFKIVELVIFTFPNQGPFANTDGNVEASLNSLTSWGPSGFSQRHDVGMCFLDGPGSGTIGIAYLSAICTSNRYNVVDRLSSAGANRTLVSHELGHNFAAQHVNGTNIMRPSLIVTQSWAQSSINAIENHIASRTCLSCVDEDTPGDPDPPTDPEPPVVLRTPDTPENCNPGLGYAYYEGNWRIIPDVNLLTPVKEGITENIDLNLRNRNTDYGFVFEGFIEVPTDGIYRFYASSSDGSKVFIGDELVVDNDGLHFIQERSGTIGLKRGKHAIKIPFFFTDFSEAGLEISIEGPGISKRLLPGAWLCQNKEIVGPSSCVAGTETIVDNESSDYAEAGSWGTAYYRIGSSRFSFRHDFASGKGQKIARFYSDVPQAGRYQVYMYWPRYQFASPNVPVIINHEGGTDTQFIDQQNEGWEWKFLGTYNFGTGEETYVDIRTTNTNDAWVLADQVRFICASSASTNPLSFAQTDASLDGQDAILSLSSIYPNPASDVLFIDQAGNWKGNIFFSLFDATGRIVKQKIVNKEQEKMTIEWSLSDLGAGIYLLQIDQDGDVINHRVVIK